MSLAIIWVFHALALPPLSCGHALVRRESGEEHLQVEDHAGGEHAVSEAAMWNPFDAIVGGRSSMSSRAPGMPIETFLEGDIDVAFGGGSLGGGSLGSRRSSGSDLEHTSVVTSWVLVAMVSKGGRVGQQTFKTLAEGLRYSLADTIGLCRQSLHVKDMRAYSMDFQVEPFVALEQQREHKRRSPHSLLERMGRAVGMHGRDVLDDLMFINVTQIKAMYEVRVLPELQRGKDEVVDKVRRLQHFGKFNDLSRSFDYTLYSLNSTLADMVMVDDIGLPEEQWVERPKLTSAERADCMQETLLSQARGAHEYVLVCAFILVLMITCAGSAVFTLKQPSLVPSRLNPLIRPPYI